MDTASVLHRGDTAAVGGDNPGLMTLYSSPSCFLSHRTRMVLAEKDIAIDIINVEGDQMPEDLIDLNPYNSVPTLVDRELVLYDSRVIIDYLDERFPHPPLMPVDPVSRAQFRLALYRIERDWYTLAAKLQAGGDRRRLGRVRRQLQESITASSEIFGLKPFFLSDEFSLIDCSIAPVLWRLPAFGVELKGEVQPIRQYMDNLFGRPSFQESLTESEREMRQ